MDVVFNPNHVEADGDILNIYFKTNGLSIKVKKKVYKLNETESNVIRYDLVNKKLIEKEVLEFISEDGKIKHYNGPQVYNSSGIKELFDAYTSELLKDEQYIRVRKDIEELIQEMVKVNCDNLIDKCLLERDFEGIKLLMSMK